MKFLITTRLFDLVKYRNIQRWNKRYYATAGCTDFKVCEAILLKLMRSNYLNNPLTMSETDSGLAICIRRPNKT